MDVKVVFVIVCLCALAITSTEAGIPKCCMSTKNPINQRILTYVQKWKMQEIGGPCEIQALVLYVKDFKRPVCAHPSVKADIEKLERKKKRRAAEERAAKERAAKERAAKERAAKERAAKERAAEERAAKERAAKQKNLFPRKSGCHVSHLWCL
uniref:Chemokine interleukin-8-like domain-containing protein n=1 Tax=Amphilophus citrinellus TaxID=61819 RepID=A0A3Q0R584_AMPCI